MHSKISLFSSILIPLASAATSFTGFTTFKQLTEGADNSDQIAYYAPSKSSTLFVNVQILPDGSDHSDIWTDFKSLASNYAAHKIAIIPRVRYGTSDGNITPEPSDANVIAADVLGWASLLNSTKSFVTYPIVQAGFLGQWGEWHDGPFCQVAGAGSDSASLAVKKDVVSELVKTGIKVAVRTPEDHAVLTGGVKSTSVTIHNDCIFAEGPGGADEGTFVQTDGHNAAYWQAYTKKVAGNNGYGGEGCEDTYDWSDYTQLCGSNGLVKYINDYQMAYLNVSLGLIRRLVHTC